MAARQLPAALRTLFLINIVVAAIFGVQHLLFPRLWTDLAGIQITETVTWRGLGAALLGLTAGSWIAWRDDDWRTARVVMLMQIVWCTLGALVILWGLTVEGLPPLEWLNAVLLAFFAIAFSFFLTRAPRPGG